MHEALAAVLVGRSLADLVLFLFVFAAMPVLSFWQRRRFARLGNTQLPRRRIYGRFIFQQWMLVFCILFLWWARGRPLSGLGLDVPLSGNGKVGLMVAAAVAMVVLVYRFVSLRRLDEKGRAKLLQTLAPMRIAPQTRGEVLFFAPVAVTAGIAEELLYRGFLIWYLLPASGALMAVLISAALFGLAHVYQGWRGMIGSAGLGLLFGILYAVSGSLWWVMGLHALNDLQFCLIGWYVASWNRGTVSAAG